MIFSIIGRITFFSLSIMSIHFQASGEGNAYSRSSPYFKNKTTQKPGNGKKPYRVLTEDELMLKPLQKQVTSKYRKS